MNEPACPQLAPYGLDLSPGDYSWCACGLSGSQPSCDGSHKGTDFAPLKFHVAAADKRWLCGCKRTQSPPLCDGSHRGPEAG